MDPILSDGFVLHSTDESIHGRPNSKNLDKILNYVYRQGATSKTQKNVKLSSTSKDMVMPDNFYSTTNNQTQIFLNNKWINVDDIMILT